VQDPLLHLVVVVTFLLFQLNVQQHVDLNHMMSHENVLNHNEYNHEEDHHLDGNTAEGEGEGERDTEETRKQKEKRNGGVPL